MSPQTARPVRPAPALSLLRRTERFLLALVLLLVALLAAVPVILLFFVTSVPLVIAVMLVVLDVGIIAVWLRLGRTLLIATGAVAGLLLVAVLAVVSSQMFASTPPISTPGGIARMEQVELNGSQQWITIRGESVNNPVLLFLAGAPVAANW